jgi:hypothetical protein
MRKKLMSMIATFILALGVVVFVGTNTAVHAADIEISESIHKEGEIWIEELDSNIQLLDVESVTVDNSELRYSYTIYPFSRTVNIKTVYDGNEITLFKHSLYGQMWLYEDGKVHLYSLGSSVSDVHANFSAYIDSRGIINTDGSSSMGYSDVVTSSSIYTHPCFVFSVTFVHGSNIPIYQTDEYPN